MKKQNKYIHSQRPKTMNDFTSQQGWTIWSMLFVMTVMFSLAYVGMQLVPIYSSNQNVTKAMRQSVETKDLKTIPRSQIVKSIQNQLYLDGDSDIMDFGNDLKIERSRNKFILSASYEREVPLIANLHLIARFNPKIECDLNGRCNP